jgi:hypothetical protein
MTEHLLFAVESIKVSSGVQFGPILGFVDSFKLFKRGSTFIHFEALFEFFESALVIKQVVLIRILDCQVLVLNFSFINIWPTCISWFD